VLSDFVNKLRRATDNLLQQLQKLFEPFLAVLRTWDPMPFMTLLWVKVQIRDEHPGSYFREFGNNFLG
jgi:hypothetical protein